MTSSLLLAPRRRLDVAIVGFILVTGGAAGFLGSSRPRLALAMITIGCAVAVVAAKPVLCAVLAVPALYGYQGVGLGPALGLSDVLLLAAAVLALPAVAHTSHLLTVGPVNRAFAGYLALLVPSIAAHPTGAAAREVLHRLVIVTGAVLVGVWLSQQGGVRSALRLLVGVSVVFAAVSCVVSVASGFAPAYPLGYHKNYVGTLLALTLLVVLCAPGVLGLNPILRTASTGLIVLGVMATQSRGAILGAALGGFIWLFAPRKGTGIKGRTRVGAAVLAVGFGVFATYSVQQQLSADDVSTNSVGVRRQVAAYTEELWRSSPLVGVGIRYFNTGEYGLFAQAPNNAITSELAEAGVVGATGFVGLHAVVLASLWRRRRSQLGLAALTVFCGQLLHGMFDIYWSSGLTPLPFILAGMSLSAAAAEQS